MGVHDFISFVQRNSQCIVGLTFNGKSRYAVNPRDIADVNLLAEEDRWRLDEDAEYDDSDTEYLDLSDACDGSLGDAILVKVPDDKFSADEVAAMSLSNFAQFEAFETTFSWVSMSFDFEEALGAGEHPRDGSYMSQIDNENTAKGIWKSPLHPGYWLVCFLRTEYEAFVLGAIGDEPFDPTTTPRAYYQWIFAGSDRLDATRCPDMKSEAHRMIRENIWTYSTLTLRDAENNSVESPVLNVTCIDSRAMKDFYVYADIAFGFLIMDSPAHQRTEAVARLNSQAIDVYTDLSDDDREVAKRIGLNAVPYSCTEKHPKLSALLKIHSRAPLTKSAKKR